MFDEESPLASTGPPSLIEMEDPDADGIVWIRLEYDDGSRHMIALGSADEVADSVTHWLTRNGYR